MPRSNRPRRRAPGEEVEPIDLERALMGTKRIEAKRDGAWNVQPQGAGSATKVYTCPGCGSEIAPGVAHLVAWRADGLMGEADDLAGRRHWHSHCWKIRT
ncbi:MAG: hypothetical protein JWP32_2032 [Schumannella sp.]|jgi:hypothetical protein|nr:hypothetical protein [Schumannella sp.]